MKYRILAGTGTSVSNMALGTMGFGTETEESEAFANWSTLDAVRAVASEHGVTPSQVAHSWISNRPGVIAPIMGAKTTAQLEDNLVAADLDLGEDSTAFLDRVSMPRPNDYTYGPFGEKQRGRYVQSSDQAIGELF